MRGKPARRQDEWDRFRPRRASGSSGPSGACACGGAAMWTRRRDRGPCPLRRSFNRPHHGTERQPRGPRGPTPRGTETTAHAWRGESRSARPARCSASSVPPTFGGPAETKKALTSLLQVTSPALRSGVGRFPPAIGRPGSFPASCPEILPTDTRPQARANLGEVDLGDSACRRKRQFDENQGAFAGPRPRRARGPLAPSAAPDRRAPPA